MDDSIHLGRKLIWVQDHPNPLEGESLPRLQEAITRLSRGGPLFVSLLSPTDAAELSRLCDAAFKPHMCALAGRCTSDGVAWEPKRLRLRLLDVAARLVTTGRRRILRLSKRWPWADLLISGHHQLAALA